MTSKQNNDTTKSFAGIKFPLQNPSEPNLLRSIFPYSEVLKQEFNNLNVMLKVPDEFYVTDTTFRDGQQARPPYTVQQIVDVFEMMHRMGGPKGIIRQTEFFLYSKKDKEAVNRCLDKGYAFPEVTGWIRATKSDFKLVKEMGLKETGILTSCSDYHIYLKLKLNRQQALEKYLDVVKEALGLGIIPRCHLEDITRADFFGFVIPFVQELMSLAKESGIPIKVRACDTMGYGVPYANASIPTGVPQLIYGLQHYGGVPSAQLEWHGHNDFHKVMINASTAWLAGCGAVNGSILGFGERTGNSPVEALMMEYIMLKGSNEGIDTLMLNKIARYFENELGFHIPTNYPLVGADFNTTRAGIHADGAMKNEEIYNIFDTKKILGRKIGISITDKSGIAGILYWINAHIPSSNKTIDKKHPGVAKIYKKILKEYDVNERLTSFSNEEMYNLVKKYVPEVFESNLTKAKKHADAIACSLIEEIVENKVFTSMDKGGQENKFAELIAENPFIQLAYTVNNKGFKFTDNITHIKYKAKYDIVDSNDNFYKRPWFIEPMTSGETFVSDFYQSLTTSALCITVSTPIRDKKMEIIGIIGIDIQFDDLLKLAENDEYY